MKNLLSKMIAVVMFCSAIFSCRGKDDVHISVDESNGKLNLKVEANKKGKDIDYSNSFDVEGLDKAQKDAMVKHVLDSLGVNK